MVARPVPILGTVGTVLAGYRVIELGMWVAAPGAGGLLADWGADVVKVEAPEGDPMRRLFALLAGHGQPASPPFDHDNRGKRSVVLDLSTPEGRHDMGRLLADADVLLTNLRPAALGRMGLDPATVLAEHPRLVYASITGYGLSGPDADRAGYDIGAFWARSGVAHTMAPQGTPPFPLRGGFGDHTTALATVAGVLAALLERERTGRGSLVEASLLRTGMWCLGWDVAIQERFGKVVPTAARHDDPNPMAAPYRAGDGRWFWLLGVEADRLWPKLCAAMERPDWAAEERWSTARGRRKAAPDLVAALDEAFAAHDREELARRFDAHDVWWAPVNTLADLADDAQVQAVGALVDVPGGAWGPAHRAAGSPVVFHPGGDAAEGGSSPVGSVPAGPVPALGEHTDAVLDPDDP